MKQKLFLIIGTLQREKIKITLSKHNKLEYFEFKTEDQSRDLLPRIQKLLLDQKIALENLDAILVNTDIGSYTGVRVGVTVANTLAWSLDIPVLGYQNDNLNQILDIAKSSPAHFSKLVLPTYLLI